MTLEDQLPHPILREWLIALARPVGQISEPDHPEHYARRITPIADAEWVEINPLPSHRYGGLVVCPRCRENPPEPEKRRTKKPRQPLKFSLEYARVPQALREAVGRKAPVAYWFGQCYSCHLVMWAEDDGSEPSKAEAA